MNTTKKTARLAGILYLIWILTGLYGIFYVPPKVIVRGDAVATANNILEHEFLFRTYILNDLISNALWVFLVLVLYRLFKQVDKRQAKLMVALVIVQVPAGFFMEVFNIASLMILKGELLKTFELTQKQDLAMFFLTMIDYGVLTLVLFWGLWLFPLAILVYRSRLLPRFLAVWLIITGFFYLVLSLTGIMLPQYKDMVSHSPFALPAEIGEVAFMLWLLIKGAKELPLVDTASVVG